MASHTAAPLQYAASSSIEVSQGSFFVSIVALLIVGFFTLAPFSLCFFSAFGLTSSSKAIAENRIPLRDKRYKTHVKFIFSLGFAYYSCFVLMWPFVFTAFFSKNELAALASIGIINLLFTAMLAIKLCSYTRQLYSLLSMLTEQGKKGVIDNSVKKVLTSIEIGILTLLLLVALVDQIVVIVVARKNNVESFWMAMQISPFLSTFICLALIGFFVTTLVKASKLIKADGKEKSYKAHVKTLQNVRKTSIVNITLLSALVVFLIVATVLSPTLTGMLNFVSPQNFSKQAYRNLIWAMNTYIQMVIYFAFASTEQFMGVFTFRWFLEKNAVLDFSGDMATPEREDEVSMTTPLTGGASRDFDNMFQMEDVYDEDDEVGNGIK